MEKSMDEGRTNGVLRDIELGIIPDPGELKAALEFTIQSPHVLCSVPERARNVIESSNIDAEDLGKVAFAIGVSNLDPAQKARLLQSVAVTPIADEITLLTVTTVALSCLHVGRSLIDVLRAVSFDHRVAKAQHLSLITDIRPMKMDSIGSRRCGPAELAGLLESGLRQITQRQMNTCLAQLHCKGTTNAAACACDHSNLVGLDVHVCLLMRRLCRRHSPRISIAAYQAQAAVFTADPANQNAVSC
jgi:hypothetical protein